MRLAGSSEVDDPAYLLTAGGDRCVRYWSFEESRPSFTVCGIERSGVRDTYRKIGFEWRCSQEPMNIMEKRRNEEVRPIHSKAITDMVLMGEEKEEFLVTSSLDGQIRLWK